MACSRSANVHRYHDAELSPAERKATESHVRACGECRELLADLQGLSALISGAPLASMPAGAVGRLQQRWRTTQDRGVLRIASWLTATAAAVLIGTLLTGPANRGDVAARPAVWQTVAVMPPVEAQEDIGSDQAVLAQWMADELSSGERR